MEQQIQIDLEGLGDKCELGSSGSYERGYGPSLSIKFGTFLRS
jgi:hypothetical protein